VKNGNTALADLGENGKTQFTNIGKAIGGIALVGSIVGIAETVASVANSVNDIDSRTQLAFDNLRNNLDGTSQEAANAFANLVEVEDKSAEFAGIWQGLGAEVRFDGIAADVEEFSTAIDEVNQSLGPAAAQKILDGLKEQNEALDRNSDQYRTNKDAIDKAQVAVTERQEAITNATIAERDQKRAVEEATDAYDRQTGTIDGVKSVLQDAQNVLKNLKTEYDVNAAAAKGFNDAIERSTFKDDQIGAALNFSDAMGKALETVGALPDELDAAKIALVGVGDQSTDTGEKALGAFLAIGDQTSKLLSTFIQAGDPEGARNLATLLRAQVIQALQDQGITDPQRVDELLGLVGLQDLQIEGAITFANLEGELLRVQTTIALFEQTLAKAPPELLLKVQDQVLAGDLQGANTTIRNWVAATSDDPATSEIGVQALLTQFPDIAPEIDKAQKKADEKPVKVKAEFFTVNDPTALIVTALEKGLGIDIPGFANGGRIDANQLAVVGERGPELFLPSSAGTIIPNSQLGNLGQSTSNNQTLNLTQNITSGDPILTAAEVVRRQRDAEFLAGV
jgi:hypothetical protein